MWKLFIPLVLPYMTSWYLMCLCDDPNFKLPQMKKLLPCLIFLYSSISFAQDAKYYTYSYWNKNFTAYDFIEIAEKVKWTPLPNGAYKGSFKTFESVFSDFSDNSKVIEQLERSGRYYCDKNHDYLFEKYNKLYVPVTMVTWNETCPVLYTLMHSDETK